MTTTTNEPGYAPLPGVNCAETPGARLREALEMREVSIGRFAFHMGVGVPTVERWLRDQNRFPATKRRLAAKLLGVSLRYLNGEADR